MQRVLVDANVLLSRTQRDWLLMLNLELGGMFSLITTEDILAEVVYRFRRNNQLADGGSISNLGIKIRKFMDEILIDYDCSQPYSGDDPNDRHVHAAARDGGCDILLTSDKGFVRLAASEELPYSVYEADAFFTLIDDSSTRTVLEVTEKQLAYWKEKGEGGELTRRLKAAKCPDFADRVEMHLLSLAGIPLYSPERKRHIEILRAHRPEK